jgi:hypothetical protein
VRAATVIGSSHCGGASSTDVGHGQLPLWPQIAGQAAEAAMVAESFTVHAANSLPTNDIDIKTVLM